MKYELDISKKEDIIYLLTIGLDLDEIEMMKSSIKRAYGNVLIYGLGLGYFSI